MWQSRPALERMLRAARRTANYEAGRRADLLVRVQDLEDTRTALVEEMEALHLEVLWWRNVARHPEIQALMARMGQGHQPASDPALLCWARGTR